MLVKKLHSGNLNLRRKIISGKLNFQSTVLLEISVASVSGEVPDPLESNTDCFGNIFENLSTGEFQEKSNTMDSEAVGVNEGLTEEHLKSKLLFSKECLLLILCFQWTKTVQNEHTI